MNRVGSVGPIGRLPVLVTDLLCAVVHMLGAGIARSFLLGATFAFNLTIRGQPAKGFLRSTLRVSHGS